MFELQDAANYFGQITSPWTSHTATTEAVNFAPTHNFWSLLCLRPKVFIWPPHLHLPDLSFDIICSNRASQRPPTPCEHSACSPRPVANLSVLFWMFSGDRCRRQTSTSSHSPRTYSRRCGKPATASSGQGRSSSWHFSSQEGSSPATCWKPDLSIFIAPRQLVDLDDLTLGGGQGGGRGFQPCFFFCQRPDPLVPRDRHRPWLWDLEQWQLETRYYTKMCCVILRTIGCLWPCLSESASFEHCALSKTFLSNC